MGGGGAELVVSAKRNRVGARMTEITTGPDRSTGATAASGVTACSRTGCASGAEAPTAAASSSGVRAAAVSADVLGAPDALRRAVFSAWVRP